MDFHTLKSDKSNPLIASNALTPLIAGKGYFGKHGVKSEESYLNQFENIHFAIMTNNSGLSSVESHDVQAPKYFFSSDHRDDHVKRNDPLGDFMDENGHFRIRDFFKSSHMIYTKPSLVEGFNKRDYNAVLRSYDTATGVFKNASIYATKAKDFGKYGPGLQIFFTFMSWATIVFLIVFLLNLPLLITNVGSDGFASSENPIDYVYSAFFRTSIANYGFCGQQNDACDTRERSHNRCLFNPHIGDGKQDAAQSSDDLWKQCGPGTDTVFFRNNQQF